MPAGLSQMTQSNAFFSAVDDLLDAFGREIVLVARLRGREQKERLDALVADQRLRQLGLALDDVDQVVDDPAFRPHDEVEIAQADIEIDHDDLVAALRQRCPKCGSRRGLADAALAGCNHDYLAH